MRQFFSPKRTGESITLCFDFVKLLGSAETISSAVWTIEVVDGDDPASSGMLSGGTAIGGTKVSQRIQNGVDGVVYRMVCAASTSSGQVIHGTGLIKVDDGDA